MQRNSHLPRVEIVYCTRCRFLLRAAWIAQELLATFAERLGEVALVPGAGGVLEVRLGDETLYSRKTMGEVDPTALKRAVRDRVAPDMRIGHEEP
ncbi:MAG: SelT/SelW/SelH family protein [Gammaproteobacteria bacterium]|nr:SelT/SelW/SelH family protein [Gammaproteobacteria bacterium]NIR59757.1 SelT/SelW/SelH family protein [Gammaproteobacteria bacterium]NIR89567.1 SelT/SelW/SelH family protein [Gammaproteobacteria bacterium]NIV74809.1 SelT/SelW/SelH family protein [Gammaproteobacteria bacterium]